MLQVWFKWRVNNQDIRLLDVTTNQPMSAKANHKEERQRDNASCSKAKSGPESDKKEEDTIDVRCGLPKTSSAEELIQVKDLTTESHTVYLDVGTESEEGAGERVSEPEDPIYISPVSRLHEAATAVTPGPAVSRLQPLSPTPPFSTPLSPVVIPQDPGSVYSSMIVSSTPETDIYATSEQLGSAGTYLCPYLPDLKNHFMTIGNKSGGETRSRGTFSPRRATPFKHRNRTTDYERL